MSLDLRLREQVKARLVRDYDFRDAGTYLRQGKCPKCKKKELFASAEKPRLIICGRKDKCGYEEEVRELYPELFEDWSKLTRDDPSPTAAADGYLQHVRGFDLQGLRGAYTQERYHDRKLDLGSASARFPLPGGSWWERLIDQPQRFDRKAHFAPGASYAGQAWMLPGRTIADYAAAREIWLTEGIFNSIALEQGAFAPERRDAQAKAAEGETVTGDLTASLMSCYNWPEKFLDELRRAIATGPTPTKRPRLVLALDNGAAGTEYTRRFVARARDEGWEADAALARLEDEPGRDLDWNDLFQRSRLTSADRKRYRWHGDVLLAATEREKAFLLWREKGWPSFHFTFETRTFWASFSDAAIDARVADYEEKGPSDAIFDYARDRDLDEREMAALEVSRVAMIANCTFRALYFERSETTDTSAYWFRIDRPGDWPTVKASFPGSAISGSARFKERLVSVASGAIWTGEQSQLDRIAQRQLPVRDVTSIEFTGYCREHGIYVFGDLAVSKGKVYRPNADDYFEVGKTAIKLRSSERILTALEYDPDKLDTSWLDPFWVAWGPRGLACAAFFALSIFAEQVRAAHKSLGFLELTGIAGSGKSTMIEFLWQLFGRENYEGFDPQKSTQAGIARELAKVANMPVAFIEGDRNDEAHSKSPKFDWDETKTLYNGRATRTRGVKSDGLETYSPPFRGAFVIVQNDPVQASRAVLERIMSVHFDKSGWNADTKKAAERIGAWKTESASGFLIHAARREAEVLARFVERFPDHEEMLTALPGVTNARLAKTHAQLLAMVDALKLLIPNVRDDQLEATRDFIRTMAIDRHRAVATDHPHVETFWERFAWIEENENDPMVEFPINHARDENLIAIRLPEFEQRCADRRLHIPPMGELKKLLKTSKRYPFVDAKAVNSRRQRGGVVHCWVFQRTPAKA